MLCACCLQLLETVNGPPLQRAAAWDSGGAAANFAAVVPPLLASPALSGALASDVGFLKGSAVEVCCQRPAAGNQWRI